MMCVNSITSSAWRSHTHTHEDGERGMVCVTQDDMIGWGVGLGM